jgi:3-phosphoshikimate 1-carboxyvinyltransferase
LLVPGSEVTVENVGLNPTRAGLYKLLEAMGADLRYTNERIVGGEPVADIVARASSLQGVEPDPDSAASMIDEFPIAFVAAALAQGRSTFRGLEELRVKESDRIATMAEGLRAIGVQVEEIPDGLIIDGTAGDPLRGSASTTASR